MSHAAGDSHLCVRAGALHIALQKWGGSFDRFLTVRAFPGLG